MKLQEVYASEQNDIGSWVAIGYKDPAGGTGSQSGETTNFYYSQGTKNTADWLAVSHVGLNDCQANSTKWAVAATYSNSTGNVDFQPKFKGSDTKCTVAGLTPNFCKIGSKTSCTDTGL